MQLNQRRAYRRAVSEEDALAEIRRHSGTQFDPAVVDAFVRLSKAGAVGEA